LDAVAGLNGNYVRRPDEEPGCAALYDDARSSELVDDDAFDGYRIAPGGFGGIERQHLAVLG
jgi:hypothetical protein